MDRWADGLSQTYGRMGGQPHRWTDGHTDNQISFQWLNSGKTGSLRAIDLDSSDNLTEEMLGKFLDRWVAGGGIGRRTDGLKRQQKKEGPNRQTYS